MPFPTVSIGQKIRASWGNLVAARFNEAHTLLAFTPAGNTDASTGAEADWITLGNITVPTWAVSAKVTMHVTGIQEITVIGNAYNLRTRIGAAMDGSLNRFSEPGNGVAGVQAIWIDRITLTASGSQSVKVRAARAAGTGQWRVGTLARITADFTFLDN